MAVSPCIKGNADLGHAANFDTVKNSPVGYGLSFKVVVLGLIQVTIYPIYRVMDPIGKIAIIALVKISLGALRYGHKKCTCNKVHHQQHFSDWSGEIRNKRLFSQTTRQLGSHTFSLMVGNSNCYDHRMVLLNKFSRK